MLSDEIAISVKNLTKKYRIFGHPGDRIKQAFTFGQVRFHREFTALQDVSFEIKKGETVGIIGRNGSGKSTLLQLICGILKPTSGTVKVNGRVFALLELGAGFNPEFTGRENVYFQGAVIGLTKEEMDERFEGIVSFADIGEFIEQPVRTYSSGMFVRLAFAVMAHVDAEILVIDEALSVGDAFFTQKCLRFLRNFQKTGTVLFVSHDTAAIVNLCQRVLWIDGGESQMLDSAKKVCEAYLTSAYSKKLSVMDETATPQYLASPEKSTRDMRLDFINQSNLRNDIEVFSFSDEYNGFGTGGAKIVRVRFLDSDHQALSWIVGGEPVCLMVEAIATTAIQKAIVGFFVKDRLGQILFGDNTHLSHISNPISVDVGERIVASFEFYMPILRKGIYMVDIAIADEIQGGNKQLEWRLDAISLNSHSTSISTGLVGIPYRKIRLWKA